MRCYIYLGLLGESNRPFYDITTTQKGKLDIEEVQAEAEDWDKDKIRAGEGKDNGVALMAQQWTQQAQHALVAQQTTRGTGRINSDSSGLPYNCNHPQWLQVPCVACPHRNKSKNFHCMRDCFDGGLSHLNDDEKDAWLAMKRQAKAKRHGRNNGNNTNDRPWRKRQRDEDEQANLAEENKSLRQKLMQRDRTDAGFAKIAEKARE